MKTVEISTDNFQAALEKKGILLLDFWAAWCPPCRAFGPIFEAAAAKHPEIVFGKVDTEAQPQLAAAFEVRSIPTVAAFKDGVLVFSQPGMLPARALEQLIEALQKLDVQKAQQEQEANVSK